MATTIDTTNTFSRCLPSINTDIEACGAITACNAVPVTSGDLATIYGSSDSTFKVLGNLLAADFVGKAVGAKTNGMYDFLQASKRVLGGKKLAVSEVGGGVWEISPFIKMGRKRTINNEYWTVRVPAGTQASGTTEQNAAFQAADLTVRVYSQSSIPVDVRWFAAKMRVFVMGQNAADGGYGDTTYRLAFEVKSITGTGTDDNGGYITLVLTPQNAGSAFLANASSAIKAKARIPYGLSAESDGDGGAVLGLLVRGTPNVSDFESFCSQIPGLNNNQLIPFWIETTRYSICEDELTQRYLQAIKESNPLYKNFMHVESVELNRQIIEDFQRRHANNFFFNKPISANQTLANYTSLSSITMPNPSGLSMSNLYASGAGRCVGKRANATGIYEQLAECGRVVDNEGETLNLHKLFNSLYRLQREREAVGTKTDIIELFTDSFYANLFIQGMIVYYKTKYGSDIFRLTTQLNQGGEQGPFGFRFYRFILDYPQVELRIVTHRFFDDMLAAHKAAGFESSGRMLWAIDWQNVYQGIIDSNTVTNKTGDLKHLAATDDTYACVMKVPTRTTKLTSTTYTAVLEAETTSFAIEGLGATAPDGSGSNDGTYYV